MKYAKRLEKIEATFSPARLPHIVGMRRKGAKMVEGPDGQMMDETEFWKSRPVNRKFSLK